MACQIAPIFGDIDCPKELTLSRSQTIWGDIERVERGFDKGSIYLNGQTVFHINKKIPKWVKPGIRIEVNIGADGNATMQQVEK